MATEVINPGAPAMVANVSSSGIPFPVGEGGRIDLSAARPFIDDRGDTRVITNAQGDSRIIANAGLLQFQEWLDIDRTVVQTANRRLVGIADLQARGLIHTLGSIGQTVSLWDRVSEMDPANINMSGVTAGSEDTIAYATQSVPVPIVHKDFRVNIRRLEASRMFGESVDVTAASVAARLVAEASEAMLFSGAPITVEDGTIYGYRNFPGRGTVDRTAAPATATPAGFKADVQAMLAGARSRRFYGPYTLYVSADWEGFLDEFYVIEGDDGADGIAVPGRTVRDVILGLSGIERIVVADFMGAEGEAVLVQLERDVVDLAVAQDITTINWQAMGGMQERFKVMACWVPRIKSDFNGNCGIIHLRPA